MIWDCKPFTSEVDDQTGGNVKTQQKEYLPAGAYPIVDQGQQLVGGYTDDEKRLCKADLPVIIFGDHTKIFKYIDFPFCLGADGTKVLRPKNGADPKYLYYVLQQAHIPEAGYSRHFKFLKQFQIPLPTLDEQKRIAAILDKADELRRLRQRAIDRLNSLGQAIFYEMFGDPASNPKGWPVGTIRDLLKEVKYGTSKKANSEVRGFPILRMGNITYDGQIETSDLKYIELEPNEIDKYTTRRHDLLFNRTNSKELVGKTAVVKYDEIFAIAGYLIRARVNDKGNPFYISAYLNSPHGKAVLQGMCKNIVGMANINAQELQDIQIHMPPVDLQNECAERIRGIDLAKEPMENARLRVESVFLSLQSRAFNGEL